MIAVHNLEAIAENAAEYRRVIGADKRFYGVVKGDAYGFGLSKAAPVILEAGADALATANPGDIAKIRRMGIEAPILLYPSSPPKMAAQIADLGGIVSLHDFHSILAFAALGVKVLAHLKVDCGFGRMGLQEADWPQAFETIRKSPDIHLVGLYGHFGQVEDKAEVAKQMRRFNRAVDMSSSFGFRDLETMVASSRVAIGYPNCILNSVNIGRGLYGMLEGKWSEQFRQSKPLRILYAEVIQTKLLLKGMRPGYAEEPCNSDINVAILNCGFTHGLSRKAHGTPVLIHGAEAKTIGMRSTEHTVVDITGIPDVNVGDKAVVVGEQSGAKISDEKFSEASGIPLIEFYNRIGGRVDRVYVNRFSA